MNIETYTRDKGDLAYEKLNKAVSFLNENEYTFNSNTFIGKVYALSIAYVNNKIIGVSALKELSQTITELAYTFVLPEYRQKGIGKELGNKLIPLCISPFIISTTRHIKEAMNLAKSHKGILSDIGINQNTGNKLCLYVYPTNNTHKLNKWFTHWFKWLICGIFYQ